MSNKLRQAKNLTNWFGVDSIFFEKTQPIEKLTNDKFIKYNNLKGALLGCLYEMYCVLGFNPDTKIQTSSDMAKIGNTKGLLAIREAFALVDGSPDIKSAIKKSVLSLMESEKMTDAAGKRQALREIYSIALDKLLVEEAYKSGDRKELQSNRGKMVVGAYDTLKTKLVNFLI